MLKNFRPAASGIAGELNKHFTSLPAARNGVTEDMIPADFAVSATLAK
jgi:hypothetical protein